MEVSEVMGVRHPVVIETGDDCDCKNHGRARSEWTFQVTVPQGVNAVHCSVNAGGKTEMRKRVVLNTSSWKHGPKSAGVHGITSITWSKKV